MPYGNTITRLPAVIREIQLAQKRVKVEFPSVNKQFSIPSIFIHNDVKVDATREQELDIETWFLRKNRIIPIYE